MPVQFKDYYATLNVPRTATEDEIKKAFRKLARLHHPDVAKDKKGSEDKFKEINEAYEVLGDPAKRKKYDDLGPGWQDEFGAGSGPRRGSTRRGGRGPGAAGSYEREVHFGGTGFSDFFEQFFGGTGGGGYRGGFGEDEPGMRRGGQAYRGNDVEGDLLVTLNEVMEGTLRPISLQTTDPQTGREEVETFTVRIPPGAPDGKRIRVAGQGGPGLGGGPSGDLYLRVRYAAHPEFRVENGDLIHDVDLAPWDAVLGLQIVVPGLKGAIKMKIPPGTPHGSRLRLRGQGLPQGKAGERGDLFVVPQIQIPTKTTEAERELWEKLRAVSSFQPE